MKITLLKFHSNPHHWGGATKKISHSVTDVTGREKEYTLDNQGFTWVQHKSKLSGDELRDYEKVRAEYWPEVEELVKSLWYFSPLARDPAHD